MGKVHYLNLGIFPVEVGLALSQQAFDREMKRMKIDGAVDFASSTGAATHLFECEGGHTRIIIGASCPDGVEWIEQAALLAHEAVHVKQMIERDLGEKRFGAETEAYLVQSIVSQCLRLLRKEKGD
jgi:hypothetical protein